jgi:hypothetical protein
MDLLPLLKDFGVLALMLGFFVYWAKQREERGSARLTDLEDRSYNQTQEVVKVVENNTRVMTRVVECLNARPCIANALERSEDLQRRAG